MDALMAALVAAALAQIGDRPAWLAAILADRYRSRAAVIVGAAIAVAAACALAAAAGAVLAPRMTPNAKAAMLGLALLLQGGGALFRVKAPDRLVGWRLGALLTGATGLFVLLFGDGVQFIVLAFAARAGASVFAALGGTLGAGAVIAAAAVMGEAAWTGLPLRPLRLAIGILFLLIGLAVGLSGLRLI